MPRDPAQVRPAGAVPRRPLRPGHRSARPGSPCQPRRSPDQAGLLHRSIQLLRQSARSGRRAADRRRERVHQPGGERRSLLLVDGAQLVPTSAVDVQALDVDYLAFSFHKMLAPFGVGVLYAKEHLLRDSRPFLYGGDMIAEGQVSPDHVGLPRPALEVRRGHAQHPRRHRVGSGAPAAGRPGLAGRAAAALRRRRPAAAGGRRAHDGRRRPAHPGPDRSRVAGARRDRRPDRLRPGDRRSANAARRLQHRRPAARSPSPKRSTGTASNRAPAATAPHWPTANSGSTRRPAAG